MSQTPSSRTHTMSERSINRTVLLLSTATFASMVAQRMCDPMLPALASGFEVSLSQAAQVVSLFAVVYGLAQVVYGPMGDRWGKIRLIVWGALACALANAWAAMASGLSELVWARVVVAAGAAGIIPLAMAWLGDTVAPNRLQETLARMSRGTTLGLVAGQLVGGLFVDTLGWRWAFALMAAVFTVAGGLLWAEARAQTQRTAPGPGGASAGRGRGLGAQAGSAGGPSAAAAPAWQAWWTMLSTSWPRWVLVTAVIEGAAGFGLLALWATHLHQRHGLALSMSGAVVAAFGLGGLAYNLVATRLLPRLGPARLAAVGVGIAGLASAVFALSAWWWMAWPAALVAGFGFFMFHNTMQTQAASMSPTARGAGASMFAAALFAGQALGAATGAALIVRLDSGLVLLVGAVSLCLSGWVFAAALARRG